MLCLHNLRGLVSLSSFSMLQGRCLHIRRKERVTKILRNMQHSEHRTNVIMTPYNIGPTAKACTRTYQSSINLNHSSDTDLISISIFRVCDVLHMCSQSCLEKCLDEISAWCLSRTSSMTYRQCSKHCLRFGRSITALSASCSSSFGPCFRCVLWHIFIIFWRIRLSLLVRIGGQQYQSTVRPNVGRNAQST